MDTLARPERLGFKGLLGRGLPWWPAKLPFSDMEDWIVRDGMRLEEYFENGSHVIRAELPGVDPEQDVEVTVDGGAVQIVAERREHHESSEWGSLRSEFNYGRFSRRIPMPVGASENDVTATYHDGILEVRLPRDGDESGREHRVPITRT